MRQGNYPNWEMNPNFHMKENILKTFQTQHQGDTGWMSQVNTISLYSFHFFLGIKVDVEAYFYLKSFSIVTENNLVKRQA
jgi:hypothetical protein